MEEKLYYVDPYLRSTDAEITAIRGSEVYFDRTVFYPEAGGQPGDKGLFNGYCIVDTKKTLYGVAHIFDSVSGLSVGMKGILCLDWEHRYAFMEKHSAQHLISSLFYNLLKIGTVAVHLSDEYVSIELDGEVPSDNDLYRIEDAVEAAVRKGARIYSKSLSRKEVEDMHLRRSIKVEGDDIRVVFIDGFDAVPCGGVHLSSTSEIGEVSFFSSETIRGHVRTFWLVGKSAKEERRRNRESCRKLSALLSEKPWDVVPAVEKKLAEMESLKTALRHSYEKLAASEVASIPSCCRFYRTSTPLEFFRMPLKKHGFEDILLLGDGDRKEFLYIGNEQAFKSLKEKLLLRGGGREGMYQGSYSIPADEIEKEFLGMVYGK